MCDDYFPQRYSKKKMQYQLTITVTCMLYIIQYLLSESLVKLTENLCYLEWFIAHFGSDLVILLW